VSPLGLAFPLLLRERKRPQRHLDGLPLIALVDLQRDLCSWTLAQPAKDHKEGNSMRLKGIYAETPTLMLASSKQPEIIFLS